MSHLDLKNRLRQMEFLDAFSLTLFTRASVITVGTLGPMTGMRTVIQEPVLVLVLVFVFKIQNDCCCPGKLQQDGFDGSFEGLILLLLPHIIILSTGTGIITIYLGPGCREQGDRVLGSWDN
jgi:hypothetical protein